MAYNWARTPCVQPCEPPAGIAPVERLTLGSVTETDRNMAIAQEGLAEFNEQNFDSDVLQHTGLTVVDFWSQSCVPCRQLVKVLKQLALEVSDGVQIGTVKAEDNIGLLDRYGVRSTPTLVFIKDGDVVETRTGVDRRQVLKKIVETHA